MTVEQIIQEVRLCIDEKSENGASFVSASDGDNVKMNDIIKAKISDALMWVLLHAPADMLDQLDGTPSDTDDCLIFDGDISPVTIEGSEASLYELPETFMRLVRVRVEGWGRAVRTPIEEDGEKYAQLIDEVAKATIKNPEAALIRTFPNKLELWPGNGGAGAHITYINKPVTDYTSSSITSSTPVYIPLKARTAFLYYIAFLVLAAYRDPSAEMMLKIATTSIGKQ